MHDGTVRSSSASRVGRRGAGRWRGEGRRRVRVWGELGLREFRIEESHIVHDLLLKAVRDNNGDGDHSGAQTERRGGAGPVRGLLGGKDLTGRFLPNSLRVVGRFFKPS